MNLFVSWMVDQLDGLIATSLMSENVPELRRISQDIRHASDNIKAWAMAVGGSSVLDLGSIGAVEVPADRMTELPAIAKKFEEICEGTLSIGVGMTLSESHTAMRFSSIQGGDKISLYHSHMEEQIEQFDNPQEDELAGLAKAVEGGIEQPDDLVGPKAQTKIDQHGQGGKFAAKPAETHPAPAPPPVPTQDVGDMGSVPTGGPTDSSGSESDPNGGQSEAPAGDGEQQDPKAAVVAALQQIKEQAPVIEQLKQTNPDAFEAVKNVVQAMIIMAQGMASQEDESESASSSSPESTGDQGASVSKSEPHKIEISPEETPTDGVILSKDLMPGGKGDDEPDSKFDPSQLAAGIKKEMSEHGLDLARAKEIVKDHLTENPDYYSDMEKKQRDEWPVGQVKDGKIKVENHDIETRAPTGTGWHSARAGIVMGEDGGARSSRKPGA